MEFKIIPIEISHIKEVINILQLISNYKPKKSEYERIFKEFKNYPNNYGVVAINNNGKVLGFGSIIIQYKIRGGKMAHIEDIAVDKEFQNRAIGKSIMEFLVEIGRKNNCYKISLSSRENNFSFYKNCDFAQNGYTFSKLILD